MKKKVIRFCCSIIVKDVNFEMLTFIVVVDFCCRCRWLDREEQNSSTRLPCNILAQSPLPNAGDRGLCG
jgi:hypothetical protein